MNEINIKLDITNLFKDEQQKLYFDQFIAINQDIEHELYTRLIKNDFQEFKVARCSVFGAHDLIKELKKYVYGKILFGLKTLEELSNRNITPRNVKYIANKDLRVNAAIKNAKQALKYEITPKIAPENEIEIPFKLKRNHSIKIKFFNQTLVIKINENVYQLLKNKKVKTCFVDNTDLVYTIKF